MQLLPPSPTVETLRARLGKSYAWVVLIVIAGGGVASLLTSTSFTVAIPAIMGEFGVGHDVVQLTMSAYMAAMTITMLAASWLFDRFGLRRCFLYSMTFMLAVTAAGTFSPSFEFLISMRMGQGAAAGLIGPMGTVAVMRLFPPELQGRAWGVVGFAVVLGPAMAPTFGGMLIDTYGWQSIFWINLPFCLLALISGYFLLPLVPPRTERGPDWLGLALLSIASIALIVAATVIHRNGLFSWQVQSAAAVSVAMVLAFLAHAKRIDNPIISPGIFRHRRVALGAVVSIIYGVGLYCSTYLVPLFVQTALGYSATNAGFALLPAGVVLAFTMLIGGFWVDHSSPRWISVFGLVLFGIPFFALWWFASTINYSAVVIAAVVSRIGLGVLLPALNLGSLRGLHGSELGQATTFLQYLRQIGGMVGVAAVAVYVEWRSHRLGLTPDAVLTAFSEGFLVIAVAFGLSVIAAWHMRDDDAKSDSG